MTVPVLPKMHCPDCSSAFMNLVNLPTLSIWRCPKCEIEYPANLRPARMPKQKASPAAVPTSSNVSYIGTEANTSRTSTVRQNKNSRTNSFERNRKQRHRMDLESRNVTIVEKFTAICLEPLVWNSLEEISLRENRTLDQTCTHVYNLQRNSSDPFSIVSRNAFTAELRVYAIAYFRSATTETGHMAAGHGSMKANVNLIHG